MSLDEQIDSALKTLVLYALRIYSKASDAYTYTTDVYTRLSGAIRSVFERDDYIFFEGHDIPFGLRGFDAQLLEADRKLVYYNRETRTFSVPWATATRKKNLPYLSAEIRWGDRMLFDMTDWISTVTYTTENVPNIRRIVSAWMLDSKIVVNIAQHHYKVHVITEEGEEEALCLTESGEAVAVATTEADIEDLVRGC
jgi:hypothetical protein